MRSLTEAARTICYLTAVQIDIAQQADDEAARHKAHKRVALLVPIAKGWSTEIAQEVTYLGVQIHGGMGFVEETGVAQHQRDARILPIYEGTNGIQALDLVGRKILNDKGAAMTDMIADMEHDLAHLGGQLTSMQAQHMQASIQALQDSYQTLLATTEDPLLPGAISFDMLMLAGYVTGGWQMMRAATLVQQHDNADFVASKQATVAYYMEHLLPRYAAHAASIKAGSTSVMAIPIDKM
jgi:hypothetical protein